MTYVHVDNPDLPVSWFKSCPEEITRKVIGPCPHRCPHNLTRVVAWGPDLAHYELIVCDVVAGCNRNCRSWSDPNGRIVAYMLLTEAQVV
jgi:hypothetical protein